MMDTVLSKSLWSCLDHVTSICVDWWTAMISWLNRVYSPLDLHSWQPEADPAAQCRCSPSAGGSESDRCWTRRDKWRICIGTRWSTFYYTLTETDVIEYISALAHVRCSCPSSDPLVVTLRSGRSRRRRTQSVHLWWILVRKQRTWDEEEKEKTALITHLLYLITLMCYSIKLSDLYMSHCVLLNKTSHE